MPSCREDDDWPRVSHAVLSPEGDRLAFNLDDGSGLRQLAGLPDGAGDPAWSPEGRELVVAAGVRGRGGSDLFVVSADGGAVRRLTDTPWGGRAPTDGGHASGGRRRLIAYERDRRIWTVRPDGERVRRLTRREGSDPSFSPRASRIAFVRRSQVYTVGARGGRLDRVTNRGGWSPSWSPDGRRIAFFRFRGRRPGIYRMGPRGGALTRIERLIADSACGCFYEDSLDWGPRR